MPTIAQSLFDATARLKAAQGESPRLDASVLLMRVTGLDRAGLLLHSDRELSPDEAALFDELVARRAAGHPVAHLTGKRAFWDLELKVTPDTLIPRPDTEILVERALDFLKGRESHARRVLDLGTGTGAVILSIKSSCPDAICLAVERSPAALEVALENAQNLGFDVTFFEGSWFDALSRDPVRKASDFPSEPLFDLIVSNPPYVEEPDPHLTRGDVRFEPLCALTSGADGLDDIRLIVSGAGAFLRGGGMLMLEHGYNQAQRVKALFEDAGFADVLTFKDYGGNDRVTVGRVK